MQKWVQLYPFSCDLELFSPFTSVLCAAGDYFPACDLEGDNHRQDRLRAPVAISPKAQFLAEIGEYFYQASSIPTLSLCIYIYLKRIRKSWQSCIWNVNFTFFSFIFLVCFLAWSIYPIFLSCFITSWELIFLLWLNRENLNRDLLTCCILGCKQMWCWSINFLSALVWGISLILVRKK